MVWVWIDLLFGPDGDLGQDLKMPCSSNLYIK